MLTDNSEGQPTTADKLLQMEFQKYAMEDFAISVQHGVNDRMGGNGFHVPTAHDTSSLLLAWFGESSVVR